MQDGELSGKVALVTGARRGLGRAMALALGEAGAQLALVDLDPCVETCSDARAVGIEAETYAADVSDEAQIEKLEKEVIAKFGKVDILINAAGIAMRKRVTELTLSDWNRTIGVNLTGVFLLCRAFIPHMKGRGYGRIINMCSVMSHISTGDRPAYSASKAGLLGLTKAMALDLADEKIAVVGISPGAFATDMTAALREDEAKNKELMAVTPMHRYGEANEVSALARYLCSDAAGYITGTDIVIDGGWMAR
jgi:NAD(P)-dependent dehydrogenase (short-subunit alcohol dehydrogenase family)